MARRPLQEGIPLPGPPSADPQAIRTYLGALAQGLRATLSETASAVNDDLLVRPDWVRAAVFNNGDFPYTMRGTDRILVCILDGAAVNQNVTLPSLADAEPHFYTVTTLSALNNKATVVAAPAGEYLNWVLAGTKTIAQGEVAFFFGNPGTGLWWSPNTWT